MNTNTETQTTNATQTESGEKFFTQEQVNQIVSERLARERSKAATEQATTDREKALDAREQALKCRELVAGDKKYPAKLLDVLDTLTPREEKVLRLRFGLDDGHQRTLEEVGREFKVTRERIRQIEAKALRKLRHPSRSKKLRDFLN